MVRKRITHFTTDRLNAGESLNLAHFLAMSPYAFEAARILRDRGILAQLEESGESGATAAEVAETADLSINSANVLLEAGLGIKLISGEDGRFYLTMAGQYFLRDTTIVTNTNFVRDVCLPGMNHLEQSLAEERATGLQAFGEWDNVFEALPHLPAQARESWYAYNNYHSDAAFAAAIPHIFKNPPCRLLDIGGSTGRFALACLDQSDSVHVGVADIQVDTADMEPGIAAAVRAERVSLHPLDVLNAETFPHGFDAIWMSQFMPCFSEAQIGEILSKCKAALPTNGRIWMLETFWDRQRYEAAATALQMTSLYFVNVATGISRMWRSEKLIEMIQQAGLEVVALRDGIGRGHTLIELRKIHTEIP